MATSSSKSLRLPCSLWFDPRRDSASHACLHSGQEAHDREIKNAEVEEFFKGMAGLDFPTSRSAIVKKVHDKGGLDTEVLHVINQLPDRTYESAQDVGDEIWRIYREGETLEGAGPAAPSALDSKQKQLVKDMADPRRGERK